MEAPLTHESFFWFPPDLSPHRLAVHPAVSITAVACNGNHLLLHIALFGTQVLAMLFTLYHTRLLLCNSVKHVHGYAMSCYIFDFVV